MDKKVSKSHNCNGQIKRENEENFSSSESKKLCKNIPVSEKIRNCIKTLQKLKTPYDKFKHIQSLWPQGEANPVTCQSSIFKDEGTVIQFKKTDNMHDPKYKTALQFIDKNIYETREELQRLTLKERMYCRENKTYLNRYEKKTVYVCRKKISDLRQRLYLLESNKPCAVRFYEFYSKNSLKHDCFTRKQWKELTNMYSQLNDYSKFYDHY